MAYNIYIACDNCGTDDHISCNETVSMTRAIEAARNSAWEVIRYKDIRKTDFYCPECYLKMIEMGLMRPWRHSVKQE